jgi:asparagine synthase (glutamine-hydrolysing)
MCGIFALLNNNICFTDEYIKEQFKKGENRGPEFSKLENTTRNSMFGFHRLAINGLNDMSNQPIVVDNVLLICNGEIYNYKELYNMMNIIPTTDSDCEVILHLYLKYGIEQTLQMLDGVFAFVLYDYRILGDNSLQKNDKNENEHKIFIARDPYGVRPLYFLQPENDITDINNTTMPIYSVASELKVLNNFYSELNKSSKSYKLDHFQPGTYCEMRLSPNVKSTWRFHANLCRYHSTGFTSIINSMQTEKTNTYDSILQKISFHLSTAVQKRCLTTERPIACLLSGGFDSSIITALVNEYYRDISSIPLETFSIGLEGSMDLKYAKEVAEYLGTNHTEIVLKEEDFINAIPEVIEAIESYDTTSVRASIGNYLLGKYISKNSQAKVIFNGDGSDELCGGYLYMHKCPNPIEFDAESRRLLKDIHMFDVLRSDKCISSHGLEPRTPFLDRSWVQYYLSINPNIRFHPATAKMEKYLLRSAFNDDVFKNKNGKPILPQSVIWRRKEAFSDGVSGKEKSLYQIIQEETTRLCPLENAQSFADLCKEEPTMKHINELNVPKTAEQFYYRKIFETHYSGLGNVIPYFWMPKYTDANDPSARTLTLYKELSKT